MVGDGKGNLVEKQHIELSKCVEPDFADLGNGIYKHRRTSFGTVCYWIYKEHVITFKQVIRVLVGDKIIKSFCDVLRSEYLF